MGETLCAAHVVGDPYIHGFTWRFERYACVHILDAISNELEVLHIYCDGPASIDES